MKHCRIFVFVLMVGVLLVACSNTSEETETMPDLLSSAIVEEGSTIQEPVLTPVQVAQPVDTTMEQAGESSGDQGQILWPDGEVLLDEQGSIAVAVTPLNLNAPHETLDFSIGLNTHSVDLSMDLASLATLEADNGLGVQALLWDPPRGGHHVSGVLSFPAISNGEKLLEGASHLTLKIFNLDAPERSFTWRLSG